MRRRGRRVADSGCPAESDVSAVFERPKGTGTMPEIVAVTTPDGAGCALVVAADMMLEAIAPPATTARR